mmetsp:Transcript_29148/g.35403  ORF Transcript_29148/g.35403 Transcript_29148/m.35403 type:complete len:408 (+) Transcript_29148:482-1705(+)|eukprot:CAMPEP_0197866146 /NCGR_PEP_ID=MMETSP1438-20131217/44058_1 /TAXON_ID=1461541 /ORGANISM="Pterosperma sp., Strain CCMP1384" /LENGTH=407 /DNA_ID=CAMNT_0043484691 /DNA_START=252 /DNA_END=1475 /DNA_ORIENTATION=+
MSQAYGCNFRPSVGAHLALQSIVRPGRSPRPYQLCYHSSQLRLNKRQFPSKLRRSRRNLLTQAAVFPQDNSRDDDICEVTVKKQQRVKPGNFLELAAHNFDLEFGGISDTLDDMVYRVGRKVLPSIFDSRPKGMPDCMEFVLDDEAVKSLGEAHERAEDEPAAIRALFNLTINLLDRVYAGKPIQRFWVLEVIARIPYFSYVSVLHLYESLGWWQNTDLSKVHFAEAYAEQHHLLIMEALGGNRQWGDRFLAQHTAIGYYWVTIIGYMMSPKWAYYFMQLVEQHAADTYSQFVEENRALLKSLPPPEVAVEYYRDGDLYMFDEFQSMRRPESRRPPVDNLLQVFENVRDDEVEHIKTLVQCQDYEWLGTAVSPHSKARREEWVTWADDINRMSGNVNTKDEEVQQKD